MDTDDAGYQREVTVSLVGMTYNGESSFQWTPTGRDVTIAGLKTTTEQDKVSFTLDANEYAIASAEGKRQTYKFNGAYAGNVTRFGLEAGIEADFQFDIPADSYYDGMIVYVTLDRLVPADDEENLEYVVQRAVGDRYLYRVPGSGRQTIKLATSEALEGDCTVTLEAQYFDTEVVTVPQLDRVTYSGDINVANAGLTFYDNLRAANNRYESSARVNIDVAEASEINVGTLTYETQRTSTSRPTRYYITGIAGFKIEDVSITGEDIDENTGVNISITVTTTYGSETVTYTKTIKELGLQK